MRTANSRQLLAYALIAFGVLALLSRIGGADWLWLALLGIVFLLGYASRKTYGFLVAGGVLLGIAVGMLFNGDSWTLLGLAAGFFAIDRVEPKPNRWALYAAGIFAALGILTALGASGILGSTGFALLLIAAGGYLIYRERSENPGSSPNVPTASTTVTPDPTAPTVTAPPPPSEPEPIVTSPVEPPPAASAPLETIPEVPAEASPASHPSPEAQTRLNRLEVWRKETASTAGTPAYIIFSNDTLFRIASANPQTPAELATIRGVGPVKLERYGDAVLAQLRGDTASPL